MALRSKEAFDQIQKYLWGLSRKQQITLAGGTALVVASLAGVRVPDRQGRYETALLRASA